MFQGLDRNGKNRFQVIMEEKISRTILMQPMRWQKNLMLMQTRMGAVGASYGGYSVFYLAGVHEGRFKAFVSHCGVFNFES